MTQSRLRLPAWLDDIFVIVTLMLGVDLLHLLSDRVGLLAAQETPGAFTLTSAAGVFLLGIVVMLPLPFLLRWLGCDWLRLCSAGGVSLSLVVLQKWSGNELVADIFVFLGVLVFFYFVFVHILYQTSDVQRSKKTTFHGAFLILCAFVAYMLFMGGSDIFFGNAKANWHLLFTVLLGFIQWVLLFLIIRSDRRGSHSMGSSLQPTNWLAIGALFTLQLAVFQNLSSFQQLTDWPTISAYFALVVTHFAALLIVNAWQPRREIATTLLRMGLFLTLILWLNSQSTVVMLIALMIGEIISFELFVTALTNVTRLTTRRWIATMIIYAIGTGLFLVLLTAHHIPFIQRSLVALLAAFILVGATTTGSPAFNRESRRFLTPSR